MTFTLLTSHWTALIQPLFLKRAFSILLSGATLYLFIYVPWCSVVVVGARLHHWKGNVQSNLQRDSSLWLSSAAAHYSLKDSLCQSMINNV